jgi:hypothetical protein
MKIAFKILVFAIIICFNSCLPKEGETFRRLRTFYSEPYNLSSMNCVISIEYKELSMTIKYNINCSNQDKSIDIWYHEIQGIEIETNALSVKTHSRGTEIPISENKTTEYKINFKENLLRMAKIKGADLVE